MSRRYDVIGPNTLEAIRRDSEITRLKDRIEKLEAALRRIRLHSREAWECKIANEALDAK